MADSVPTGIRRAAWDYLLRFTEGHEACVLCMYNNSGVGQDVTIGIGSKLFDEKYIRGNAWVKDMFYDKDDPTRAITIQDVLDDFNAAAAIPRVGNVNAQHLITEYEGLQLRTTREKSVARMAVLFEDNLKRMLAPGAYGWTFEEFSNFPADAQAGCMSYSYGVPGWVHPLIKTAIHKWDFHAASCEVWLHKAAFEKNVAHQTLFWNAARVVEQNLDFDRVWSQPPADPARLAWKIWWEQSIDLDADSSTLAMHNAEVAKPKFGDPVPAVYKKKYPGDFKP